MAISKTLSIGAHLNPTETEQANLGTSSLKWNTIYAKTVSATSLSGTLSASNISGTIPVSKGGTGSTTASGARSNLGLTLSESGNRFDVIPKIGADGVMEAGKYIDFHNTDGDTSDYAARMTCGNNGSIDFSNGITSGGSPILTMQSYILKNVTINAGSYNTQTMTINVPTGYYALGTLGYYLYNTSQGITMTRCFITAKTNKVYVNLYNSSSSSKTMSGESWVKVLFVKQEMVGTLKDPIAPASYS